MDDSLPPDSIAEDQDLLGRIQSDPADREAHRRLVEKYWRLLVAWLRPRVRDSAEADDVAQETFIRVFRALGQMEDRRCFLPWLLRIAANQASDLRRRRKRERSLDELIESGSAPAEAQTPAVDPAAELDREEDRVHLVRAVDRLPEKYRLVVFLRYFQGLRGSEIATLLNEPEGTIRNRLFRAHEKIRALLAGSPPPSGSEATGTAGAERTGTPADGGAEPDSRGPSRRVWSGNDA